MEPTFGKGVKLSRIIPDYATGPSGPSHEMINDMRATSLLKEREPRRGFKARFMSLGRAREPREHLSLLGNQKNGHKDLGPPRGGTFPHAAV